MNIGTFYHTEEVDFWWNPVKDRLLRIYFSLRVDFWKT